MPDGLTLEQLQAQGGKPAEGLTFEQLQQRGGKPLGVKIKQVAKKVDNTIGKTMVWAHGHPFEAFMDVAGAPDRALQAGEVNENPLQAFMNPKQEPHLEDALRKPIPPGSDVSPLMTPRYIGAALGQAERPGGALAGNDLGHKIMRGLADTAFDVGNSPTTFASEVKIPKYAVQLLSKTKPVVKLGEMVQKTPLGAIFHGEHDIAGFTDHGRAVIEAAVNRAQEASKKTLAEAEAFIARNAEAIRKGDLESAAEKFGIAGSRKPQEFIAAIRKLQAPKTAAAIKKELRAAGILPSTAKAAKNLAPDLHKLVYKNPDNAQAIKAAQAGLAKFIAPQVEDDNAVWKTLRYLTHRGNQAFLSNPVPHAMNLLDLSHQRYGIGTTLQGVANAARVAAGKTGGTLGKQILELEQTGARSQYGKLFSEIGFGGTHLPGKAGSVVNAATGAAAKTANIAAIPFQRASNWAQHAVLNNLETGLRASALGAEQKGGKAGVDAARSIHQAFGTDPANAIAKAGVAQPFSKFHFQTVPAAGIRTLVNEPARIINMVKAQIDMNQAINPGTSPKFTPTVPSLSFARMAGSFGLAYPQGLSGPIGALYSGYGAATQAQKGKIAEAVGKALGRYIPASQVTDVLYDLATGGKGDAGEPATSDILPILTGGYWQKPPKRTP